MLFMYGVLSLYFSKLFILYLWNLDFPFTQKFLGRQLCFHIFSLMLGQAPNFLGVALHNPLFVGLKNVTWFRLIIT